MSSFSTTTTAPTASSSRSISASLTSEDDAGDGDAALQEGKSGGKPKTRRRRRAVRSARGARSARLAGGGSSTLVVPDLVGGQHRRTGSVGSSYSVSSFDGSTSTRAARIAAREPNRRRKRRRRRMVQTARTPRTLLSRSSPRIPGVAVPTTPRSMVVRVLLETGARRLILFPPFVWVLLGCVVL